MTQNRRKVVDRLTGQVAYTTFTPDGREVVITQQDGRTFSEDVGTRWTPAEKSMSECPLCGTLTRNVALHLSTTH